MARRYGHADLAGDAGLLDEVAGDAGLLDEVRAAGAREAGRFGYQPLRHRPL